MASRVDYTVSNMPLPVNFKRGNPVPMDADAVWQSEAAMKEYAKTGKTSYVGQILTLADGSQTKAYLILDEAGNLSEFGTSSGGDVSALSASVIQISGHARTTDNTLSSSISSLSSNASSTDFTLSSWIKEVSDELSAIISSGEVGALSGKAEATDKRLGESIRTLSGEVEAISGNAESTDNVLAGRITDLSGNIGPVTAIPGLSSNIEELFKQLAAIRTVISVLSGTYLCAFFEPETTNG